MMKKYNQSLKIGRNPNWSYIPDHAYRILIIGGLGSSKTNTLLKLKKKEKNQQSDTDQVYLQDKDLLESKYHLPVNRRKKVRI